MLKSIWFMEGLSSQRDIIIAVKEVRDTQSLSFNIIASHRGSRPEITSVADISFVEPKNDLDRLEFIKSVIGLHNVVSIHGGRNCRWLEEHREEIQALGVSLTTGSTSLNMHEIADNKVLFARFMEQHGLPVVPSILINNVQELENQISLRVAKGELVCIKPAVGIYGIGFWILSPKVSPMAAFSNPDNRKVTPDMYLTALRKLNSSDLPEPLVLMPYLPGSESSIDMVAENGKVLAAVSRRKESSVQFIEQSGVAFELAKACALKMNADGLVNVQTRNDDQGNPFLLEINMRPSGGVCFSRACGINLSAIFALRKLGLIDQETAIKLGTKGFHSAVVRSVSSVIEVV